MSNSGQKFAHLFRSRSGSPQVGTGTVGGENPLRSSRTYAGMTAFGEKVPMIPDGVYGATAEVKDKGEVVVTPSLWSCSVAGQIEKATPILTPWGVAVLRRLIDAIRVGHYMGLTTNLRFVGIKTRRVGGIEMPAGGRAGAFVQYVSTYCKNARRDVPWGLPLAPPSPVKPQALLKALDELMRGFAQKHEAWAADVASLRLLDSVQPVLYRYDGYGAHRRQLFDGRGEPLLTFTTSEYPRRRTHISGAGADPHGGPLVVVEWGNDGSTMRAAPLVDGEPTRGKGWKDIRGHADWIIRQPEQFKPFAKLGLYGRKIVDPARGKDAQGPGWLPNNWHGELPELLGYWAEKVGIPITEPSGAFEAAEEAARDAMCEFLEEEEARQVQLDFLADQEVAPAEDPAFDLQPADNAEEELDNLPMAEEEEGARTEEQVEAEA